MSQDVSNLFVVSLRKDGFYIEFHEQNEPLDPRELVKYINCLHIPNFQMDSLKKAYYEPKGNAYKIAPPLLANSAKTKVQRSKPRKITRWLRPLFKPNTPVTIAKKILVVDSSEIMINFFKKVFNKEKFSISLAKNYQSFQANLRPNLMPDIILVTAVMGRSHMGQLAQKIRVEPKTKYLPVIMYSAPRNRQEIVRFFDYGITDFFVMPMADDQFKNNIQKYLLQVKKRITSGATASTGTDEASEKEIVLQEEELEKFDVSLHKLSNKVDTVLATPAILERVMKISEDSAAGAKELGTAVENDPATVAMILKKANTAFFGKSEPITKVHEAIVRIGFKEIKTLVLGLAVVKQFSTEQKSNGFDRLEYWKHCLGTGILAKMFAEQVRFQAPEKVFLGGMIHDIGKMILDEHANPPYDTLIMNAIKTQKRIFDVERASLSFSHTNVGKLILTKWKFPEEFCILVKRHHGVEDLEKEKCKPQDMLMTRLVYIGNLMAKAINCGSAGDLSIHELPLSAWVKEIPQLTFNKNNQSSFDKSLSETIDFLNLSSNITQPSTTTERELKQIIIFDPLMDTRPIRVTEIHLNQSGFTAQSISRFEELDHNTDLNESAVCIIHPADDAKLKESLGKVDRMFPSETPVAIIHPIQEAGTSNNNGGNQLPPPSFLTKNHTVLYEPFDTGQLHAALAPK